MSDASVRAAGHRRTQRVPPVHSGSVTDAAARTVPTQRGGGKWPALLGSLRQPRAKVAAFRALRATLVIPALFALTSQVIKNPQMTLFVTFGAFATLVLASFAGTRSQKLAAHVALGIVGSLLIPLATVVCSSATAAALVALPVVFCVIFAGATGFNAANGAFAALLAYILPAASRGTVATIPSRLDGWWLATAVGTIAVLVLSPRRPANPLRNAASATSAVLATELGAALSGVADPARAARVDEASSHLTAAFTAAPYRPTGLAIADQALAQVVEALQWCASLVSDLVNDATDLSPTSSAVAKRNRQLLETSSRVLRDVSQALAGSPVALSDGDLDSLSRHDSQDFQGVDTREIHEAVHVAFYASQLAQAVRGVAVNALVVLGGDETGSVKDASRFGAFVDRTRERVAAAARDLRDQLSIRSVWVQNGARGAVAIAAAVAVADLVTDVRHGFWIVLGTLAVLRTSAASTGVNAWRGLLGTVLGVLIGGGLVIGIGKTSAALWVAFVLAVLVAAYAPGVLPFLVGQAAFTVMIVVLYNVIAPVGWKVGEYRVEDIGIGVGVSAFVGVLFWPRGAGAAIADDLADALHRGGLYLVQATSWALATRTAPPEGMAVVQATERLEDATRTWIAEQGAKRMSNEQVWSLVGGVVRLRLTGASLAATSRPDQPPSDRTRYKLVHESMDIAGECDDLAAKLGRVDETVVRELAGLLPMFASFETSSVPRVLWVNEHLEHARAAVLSMAGPADAVARVRRTPWWR
jgi:hypothetical protein